MAILETDKKKVLGRGLASLIPEAKTGEGAPVLPKKEFFLCDIEKITPNSYQPRKIFSKEALDELVESIRVHGIIQPLVVRFHNGRYELIAGERRWRAAQKAGLKQVPVVVKECSEDVASLEMAIIENVQRENLNCIEEAMAYQQLMDEFQLSQEEIANRVGKNRATVANTLRLLKLTVSVREDVASGKISMGHARAILALESPADQAHVRDLILKKKFSVRETERKVAEMLKAKDQDPTATNVMQTHMKALEEELRRVLAVPVRLVGSEEKGFFQISYSNRNDLMRIADHLKGQNASS